MRNKINTERHTIKEDVILDFLSQKILAEQDGSYFFPSGLLKYYLYDKGYLTYAGRIIGEYCHLNNIMIVRASTLGVKEWKGEKIHGNQKLFVFNKKK